MLAEGIIDELSINAIIGCQPSERVNRQRITVSLAIKYDISLPSQTDDISNALDYFVLSNEIKSYVENSEFNLLESLSNKILDIVFNNSQVMNATVIVYKPNAIEGIKRVGIKLSRVRKVEFVQNQKELSW